MGVTAHPPRVPPASWDEVRAAPGIDAEAAARRALRRQIARLERQLADAFVTAFPMGGLPQTEAGSAGVGLGGGGCARVLDLGELERVRDELADRLRQARLTIAQRADEQEQKRQALGLMLLDPGAHRWERISRRELGEPGCGAWHVRPRWGVLGMLMGWWRVVVSSGCPLAGATETASRPPVAGVLTPCARC